MQQALGRRRVTVVLDERDQVALTRQAVVEQPGLVMNKQVNANQQVRPMSEALLQVQFTADLPSHSGQLPRRGSENVSLDMRGVGPLTLSVILCLVRNDGSGNEMAPGTIGFLNVSILSSRLCPMPDVSVQQSRQRCHVSGEAWDVYHGQRTSACQPQ